MKILILGLGVIGSTYGYILRKSGHDVAHYIRPTSQNHATESLSVSLLDGRHDKKGQQKEDHYPITRAIPGSRYDFIIVSKPFATTASKERYYSSAAYGKVANISNVSWPEGLICWAIPLQEDD